MTLKNITDNVKYILGVKTLLILVYDDIGVELACELFEIRHSGRTSCIKNADTPEPYIGTEESETAKNGLQPIPAYPDSVTAEQ